MSSLFEIMTRGNWDEIAERYRGKDRRVKIADSGDTVMHIAVRLAETEQIRKLVTKIKDDEAFEILSLKNDRGNTPLHLAAELGNVVVCCCIAAKDHRLLSVANSDEETPLYVSVANGQKEAFFYLDFLLQKSRRESGVQGIDYSLYKRKKGYTILHSAIFLGYFGLAIQIVDIYPDLVNLADDSGLSPLHYLAMKDAAFKSGSFLGKIDCKLIEFLNVEQLVEEEKKRPFIDLHLLRSEYSVISFHQGKEKRMLGSTVGPILCKTVVFISYFGSFIKTFLKIAGIGWLDIHHLIKHGLQKRKNLIEKKIRWELAESLLKELVDKSSMYYKIDSNKPNPRSNHDEQSSTHQRKKSKKVEPVIKKLDSPFLVAVKHGIIEVVEAILVKYPVAIYDVDSEHKNAAMLAAGYHYINVYDFLVDKYPEAMKRMRVQLDNKGNSVLHHCATYGGYIVLYTPELASLLRTEYTWYKKVKDETPPGIVALQNYKGLIADDLFVTTHKHVTKNGRDWLLKTSESCSVVAALIATVAFATLAIDTPSTDSENPMFVGVSLFDFYCFFGLLALCFSIVSVLYFLAVGTSSFRVIDFDEHLPMKIFLGLMFLLLSMVSILASFCFRHYSMLENDIIKRIAIPIYILTSIRVLSLAASQLPFYHGIFFQSKFREPI